MMKNFKKTLFGSRKAKKEMQAESLVDHETAVVPEAANDEMRPAEAETVPTGDTAEEKMEEEPSLLKGRPYIFLSYCHQNKELVEPVKKGLNDRGIAVWIDAEQLHFGSHMLDKMADGIAGSSAVMLCYSSHYLNSFWCQREAKFSNDQRKLIIPIRCEPDVEPANWFSMLISGLIYCDISRFGPEVSVKQIVDHLREAAPDVLPPKTKALNLPDVVPEPKAPDLIQRETAQSLTADITMKKDLMEAVQNKDVGKAAVLVIGGADVNIGQGDWTPLHEAVCNGQKEMVEILCHGNANSSATNMDGETPIEMAEHDNRQDLVEIMKISKRKYADLMKITSK